MTDKVAESGRSKQAHRASHLHTHQPPTLGPWILIALLIDTCLCFPAITLNQDKTRPPLNNQTFWSSSTASSSTAVLLSNEDIKAQKSLLGLTRIKGIHCGLFCQNRWAHGQIKATSRCQHGHLCWHRYRYPSEAHLSMLICHLQFCHGGRWIYKFSVWRRRGKAVTPDMNCQTDLQICLVWKYWLKCLA